MLHLFILLKNKLYIFFSKIIYIYFNYDNIQEKEELYGQFIYID
jgi:hypothetical protein